MNFRKYLSIILFFIVSIFGPEAFSQGVFISEVLYDSPLPEDMYQFWRSNNGEYIELTNPSEEQVDISHWRLHGTLSTEVYSFPAGSKIPAQSSILLVYRAYDEKKFQATDLFPRLVKSEYSGRIFYHHDIILKNSGENIRLFNTENVLMDWIEYDGGGRNSHGSKYLYARNGYYGESKDYSKVKSLIRKQVRRTSYGVAKDYDPHDWKYGNAIPLVKKQIEDKYLEIPGADFVFGGTDGGIVGKIEDNVEVTPTGQLEYEIPIKIPTGAGGLTPNLSIGYSSGSRGGYLGMGFDIRGISQINRSPSNLHVDGVVSAVNFTETDNYMLDGQRLILLRRNIGKYEYRTENNTFSRVIAYGEENDPYAFTVHTKDGLIYEYKPSDSFIIPGSSPRPEYNLFWVCTKVSDTNGNYYTITYKPDFNNEYYPIRIDYTGNEKLGTPSHSSIQFKYRRKRNPAYFYIHGNKAKQEMLMYEISIHAKENKIKTYQLDYSNKYAGRDEQLVSITEIADDGTKYNPTRFEWDNVQNYTPQKHNPKVSKTTVALSNNEIPKDKKSTIIPRSSNPERVEFGFSETVIYTGDFNGDGKDDYLIRNRYDASDGNINISDKRYNMFSIYLSKGDSVIYAGTQHLPLQTVKTQIEDIVIGDFNGDGLADVLVTRDLYRKTKQYDYYEAFLDSDNKIGFKPGKNIEVANGKGIQTKVYTQHRVGDFNGDGILDLFFYNEAVKDKNKDKTNSERVIFYGDRNHALTRRQDFIVPTGSRHNQYHNIYIIDFNGDGLPDIGLFSPSNELFQIEINKGTDSGGNVSFEGDFNIRGVGDRIELGDFNGDGKTDIIAPAMITHSGRENCIIFSTGTGFDTQVLKNAPGLMNNDSFQMTAADFSGDGQSDIIFIGADESVIYTYKNLQFFNQTKALKLGGSRTSLISFADFNGDGKLDFVKTSIPKGMIDGIRRSTYGINYFHPNRFKEEVALPLSSEVKMEQNLGVFLMPSTPDQLLRSVHDGMGNSTIIEYKYMSDSEVYTRGNDDSPFVTSFSSVWPLVSKVRYFGAIYQEIQYKYENALVHRGGRGILGFETFTSYDVNKNIKNITEFEFQLPEYVKAVKSSHTYVKDRLVSKVENTSQLYYLNNDPSTKIFSNNLVQSDESEYDYNSGEEYLTESNSYRYDEYGNITYSSKQNGKNHLVETHNYYNNNETKWHLGRLYKAVVEKKNGKDLVKRTSEFKYDQNTGLLISETVEPSHKLSFSKEYKHDPFGNVIYSATIPVKENDKKRVIETVYDETGRFEIKIIEHLRDKQFISVKEVNSDLGLVLKETDANGMSVRYEYDAFGQLQVTETDLDRTTTSLRWNQNMSGRTNPDAPTNDVSGYYKYVEKTGASPSWEYFDKSGNLKRKMYLGLKQEKIYVDMWYNSKGELSMQIDPCNYTTDGEYYTTYSYDPMGRILEEAYNDYDITSYSYDGFITKVTSPGGINSTKEVNELGYLVKSTDNMGNSVKYTYDVSGNCIEVQGPRTTMRASYDILGNRIKLDDPDIGVSLYEYNAFGELVLQQKPNDVEVRYQFDNLGRKILEIIRHKNQSPLFYGYHYDSQMKGLLDKVELNAWSSKSLVYDEYGRINLVTEEIYGRKYDTYSRYNENNQLDKIRYPSGFEIDYEYDNYGNLLKVIEPRNNKVHWELEKANSRGQTEQFVYGNGIRTSVDYSYAGHVQGIKAAEIQDWSYRYNQDGNLLGRSDNRRGLIEDFKYDKLDRLQQVYHNGVQNQEIRYDAAGNIIYKSDVGKYEYENGTNKLKGIKADGLTRTDWLNDQRIIDYTPFGKIASIEDENLAMWIDYGTDKQRVRSVTQNDKEREVKEYIGALYEVHTIDDEEERRIHHIFAGGQAIAIYVQSGKHEEYRYLHKDHLGSVQAYSDTDGKLVGEYSYDAWGLRRNPITWETYTSLHALRTWNARGFTGHEHVDSFSLINMNGRMYDPILGRFLSPDPFVQAPDFTQSLNRYAYCLNNPLSYTDPSGYFWKGLVKTFITTAVGIGVAMIMPASIPVILTAAIGAASAGLAGALLNGANFKTTMQSTLSGAFWGAVSGGVAKGIGDLANAGKIGFFGKIALHSASQGAIEGARGGKITHGFLSGLAGQAPGMFPNSWSRFGRVAANAAAGGTASVLSGGKFTNGAMTGAYIMMFNDLRHEKKQQQQQAKIKDVSVWDGARAISKGIIGIGIEGTIDLSYIGSGGVAPFKSIVTLGEDFSIDLGLYSDLTYGVASGAEIAITAKVTFYFYSGDSALINSESFEGYAYNLSAGVSPIPLLGAGSAVSVSAPRHGGYIFGVSRFVGFSFGSKVIIKGQKSITLPWRKGANIKDY